MRLLFITTSLPSQLIHGGEQWSQTLIEGLRGQGADVHVLGLAHPGHSPAPGEIAAGRLPTGTRAQTALWGATALGAGRAFSVQRWMTSSCRARLRDVLAAGWDLAVIDHAQMGWVTPLLGALPFVHVSHQAESLHYAEQARRSGLLAPIHAREAKLMRAMERRLAADAREVWCISQIDADYFGDLGSASAITIPALCHPRWRDAAELPDPRKGPDVALLGNWLWAPNRQALHRFLQDVHPLLPAQWRIVVAGDAPAHLASSFPAVTFAGRVADGCGFLRSACRIAVPSTSRAGCNIKLLDAVAAGRPVVANHHAARLAGELPSYVGVASSAREFADRLISGGEADLEARDRWLAARKAAFDEALGQAYARLAAPAGLAPLE